MHKRKYKTCEEFIEEQNDQDSEERCTCWSLQSISEACLDCQMFDAIHEDMGDK